MDIRVTTGRDGGRSRGALITKIIVTDGRDVAAGSGGTGASALGDVDVAGDARVIDLGDIGSDCGAVRYLDIIALVIVTLLIASSSRKPHRRGVALRDGHSTEERNDVRAGRDRGPGGDAEDLGPIAITIVLGDDDVAPGSRVAHGGLITARVALGDGEITGESGEDRAADRYREPDLVAGDRAESPRALPATSVWVMEMLPGRVEFVTLAESPLPC